MDLFTHVLVAYLVSFGLVGFQPSYLAAGALAGGLPDGDIIFWPLAKRFPILRHHGITHSILGVTIVASVGGLLIAPRLAPGNPLIFFAVMEAAGLAHMLQDGFTHFSVPPFLPFSERKLELDADRAINLLTLVVSVFSFWLLLGVERNHVPFPVYLWTVYGLMAFFGLYFTVRLGARLYIGRWIRRDGRFTVPVPTSNPLTWILLAERKELGRFRTTFAKYAVGRGLLVGPLEVDVPVDAAPGAPAPTNATEALERSYPIARKASGFFEETYHFGEAAQDPARGWTATWYSLEYMAFGRAAAVRVVFPPTGAPEVHRAWHTPLWRRALT
ncbi:MAG: metal-dependent hydrolase [Thermoplasmata archaeon]|nr:metal-dependent hydrolase [Thermoplasmata archaeon]